LRFGPVFLLTSPSRTGPRGGWAIGLSPGSPEASGRPMTLAWVLADCQTPKNKSQFLLQVLSSKNFIIKKIQTLLKME